VFCGCVCVWGGGGGSHLLKVPGERKFVLRTEETVALHLLAHCWTYTPSQAGAQSCDPPSFVGTLRVPRLLVLLLLLSPQDAPGQAAVRCVVP
jgi:hypothetical protein